MLTSNGVEITKDLANRSLITRIKKHPEGHKFKIYNEGDLLDHVVANQPHYLGAVFAIVGEWIKQGMQRTPGIHHDFRKSVGAADWICRELLGRADLLDGHRDIQNRVSNPIEGKLRELALWLESNDKLDESFAAIELIDLCESAGIEIVDNRHNEADKRARALGVKLGPLFKEREIIKLDHLQVRRTVHIEPRADGRGNLEAKRYWFEKS